MRPTRAEVDLRRIQDNYRTLKSLFPAGTFFCPMIKCNAYGHGDVPVAQALRRTGAEWLGVALVEEGIVLREAGDKGDVLVFGIFGRDAAAAIFEHRLTPVATSWEQLEALATEAKRQNVTSYPLHMKFNTGMNRLGFEAEEAPRLREWCDRHSSFRLEGLCTHFFRGDDTGAPGGATETQLIAFTDAVTSFVDLKPQLHALNSSGILNLWHRVLEKKELSRGAFWPLGARPGLSLYGPEPSNDENAHVKLEPALTLKSALVSLHRIEEGESVSYSATWKARRKSLIGVVPIGYGDGYLRALSNKAQVLCRGSRVPVAGRVCMDYIMVDLTDLETSTQPPIRSGEEIVLIGEQGTERILAQELADHAGTIAYEILTNISVRVPRTYLGVE